MGSSAYLEFQPKRSLLNAFGLVGAKTLFTRKAGVPFAWFLFFAPEGASAGTLRAELPEGVTRAKERLEALRPGASTDLMQVLDAFVDLIARRGSGQLVLNAVELNIAKPELLESLKWLMLDGKKLTKRQLAEAEQLFDEGIAWGASEDDDGEPVWMELEEVTDVVGFAVEAADEALLAAIEAGEAPSPARASKAEAAEAIAAVLENPEDLPTRLVCADRLTALGDPRGELILLQCRAAELTAKQDRRLDRLWHSLQAELEAPFLPFDVSFENGFAAIARFQETPSLPIPNPEAWKTVHTLELRGSPALLSEPVFRRVRRALLDPDDVAAITHPVPFRSICLEGESAAAWLAMGSLELFPSLVEVCVETISVWLPEGAKALIDRRPELNVRSRDDVHPWALAPLTPAQQRERRARWDAPARGAHLPGARFDNGY